MNRARGVDVSHHRPIGDWQALDASGVSFIGVKATEGKTYTDPAFAAHRDGIRMSDFKLAIYYHFARMGSASDQAKHLLNTVGALQPHERLALDLEGGGPLAGFRTLDWIELFYKTLADAGIKHRPLLYTSARIWREGLANVEWKNAGKVDLWLPRYNSRFEPELPRPWLPVAPGTEIEAYAHGEWVDAVAEACNVKANTITVVYGKNVKVRRLVEDSGVNWRRRVPGWLIWQWTDGKAPFPNETPGIGACDANYFQGDEAALAAYVTSGRADATP